MKRTLTIVALLVLVIVIVAVLVKATVLVPRRAPAPAQAGLHERPGPAHGRRLPTELAAKPLQRPAHAGRQPGDYRYLRGPGGRRATLAGPASAAGP